MINPFLVINKNRHSFSPAQQGWPLFYDLITLAVLLSLTTYVVYFSSQNIARLFFLIILVLFFFTKKDYFWFAFFFIIIAQPGWLFSDFSATSMTRIPLYTFLPGKAFTPIDLFVILAIIKALSKGKKVSLLLKKPLLLILLYAFLLTVLSILFYGASMDSLATMLRRGFMYSIILSFPFLVYGKENVTRFMHLIFPIVFFILFTQLYFILAGNEFVNILSRGQRQLASTETEMIRPIMGGVILVFFSYIFSIFLLQYNPTPIVKYYLYSIVIVCFLSVFLSATRVWVIMFSFILVLYTLSIKRNTKRLMQLLSIAFILLLLLIRMTPLKLQIMESWLRIGRVVSVAQGKFYMDSSFEARYSVRLPNVLEGVKQNWILGWGFSDTFLKYDDGHVGNFNLILQVGVIGFFFFIYLWISYYKMIFQKRRELGMRNPSRYSLLILVYAFTAMLIAHFSTYTFFGLTIVEYNAFFLSIFIALSEFFVRGVQRNELVAEATQPKIDRFASPMDSPKIIKKKHTKNRYNRDLSDYVSFIITR